MHARIPKVQLPDHLMSLNFFFFLDLHTAHCQDIIVVSQATTTAGHPWTFPALLIPLYWMSFLAVPQKYTYSARKFFRVWGGLRSHLFDKPLSPNPWHRAICKCKAPKSFGSSRSIEPCTWVTYHIEYLNHIEPRTTVGMPNCDVLFYIQYASHYIKGYCTKYYFFYVILAM